MDINDINILKQDLIIEINKLAHKFELSSVIPDDYFEPGMMENLDQYYGSYVPYKIGKLQIQGFSEPITSKKIKQSYHITQKAARSRQRAAFLRGKLGRRQKFSKK